MTGDELHILEVNPSDFDMQLLAEGSRIRGTAAFRQAVLSFLDRNLSASAGWYEVSVDDHAIRATWKTAPNKPDVLSEIVSLLAKRQYGVGIQLLRMLLSSRVNDPDVHYNLGMALSDVGELEDAETHHRRALELAPEVSNARVALGVALGRERKWAQAIEDLKIAVEQDPDNGYAWRNLGGCLVRNGEWLKLRSAFAALSSHFRMIRRHGWGLRRRLMLKVGRTKRMLSMRGGRTRSVQQFG